MWSQTLSGFVTSNEFYFFITAISCELAERRYSSQSALSSFYFAIRHHRLKAETIFLLLSQVIYADRSVPRQRDTSNLQCIDIEFSVLKPRRTNPWESWIYIFRRLAEKRVQGIQLILYWLPLFRV